MSTTIYITVKHDGKSEKTFEIIFMYFFFLHLIIVQLQHCKYLQLNIISMYISYEFGLSEKVIFVAEESEARITE